MLEINEIVVRFSESEKTVDRYEVLADVLVDAYGKEEALRIAERSMKDESVVQDTESA